MGINDKAFRLRATRDRLNQTGKYRPTFKQSVALIVEILGLVHSARNLSWCRRYTARLRDQNPNPTLEQLQLLGALDDPLFRKGELIRAHQEKKKAAKANARKRAAQPTQSAPAPVPAPAVCGEPGFSSVLDELRDEGWDV